MFLTNFVIVKLGNDTIASERKLAGQDLSEKQSEELSTARQGETNKLHQKGELMFVKTTDFFFYYLISN